jgi:alpha-beta hydrolase superfamily lysophospholipase
MLKTKDGLDLFTQSWKAPDPKAILILTHGFGDHSSRYPHVGKALNDAGYSLYTYDLRGHGKSGGPRGHTPGYECLLDDLEMVIGDATKDAPGKKVFIYGHSMGGNITLNYTLRRPSGLSGAIVTGPWLKLGFEPPALQTAIARVIGSIMPAFSQQAKLDVKLLSRDLSVGEAYSKDPLVHGTTSAKLFTEIIGNAARAIEHAAELKLPVLLLHGSDDKIISLEGTKAFFQRVAGSDKTLKLYDGMRHEIHNEIGKEEVFADMIAWLDRHV